MPKFGFSHRWARIPYEVVNLKKLENLQETQITVEVLKQKGLIKKDFVKVLGHGEVHKPFKVQVHKVSASVRQAIEKAGGSVELISL